MDRKVFNNMQDNAEVQAGNYAEANSQCIVTAILVLANVLFEQVEELQKIRIALEAIQHSGRS